MANYTASIMAKIDVTGPQSLHILQSYIRLCEIVEDLHYLDDRLILPEGVDPEWEQMLRAFTDTNEAHMLVKHSEGDLYIMDIDGVFDEEQAVCFLQRMQSELDIDQPWCFEVSYSCDRHRPDSFGGAAYVVTANAVESIGTREWMNAKMSEMTPGPSPSL